MTNSSGVHTAAVQSAGQKTVVLQANTADLGALATQAEALSLATFMVWTDWTSHLLLSCLPATTKTTIYKLQAECGWGMQIIQEQSSCSFAGCRCRAHTGCPRISHSPCSRRCVRACGSSQSPTKTFVKPKVWSNLLCMFHNHAKCQHKVHVHSCEDMSQKLDIASSPHHASIWQSGACNNVTFCMSIASRVDYKVSLCLLLDYTRGITAPIYYYLMTDELSFGVPVMDGWMLRSEFGPVLLHAAFNFHACSLKLHQSTTTWWLTNFPSAYLWCTNASK